MKCMAQEVDMNQTIRAKMSERKGRIIPTLVIDRVEANDRAMAEARAILAETEGETNSLLVCVERLRPAVCAPNVYTAALAESLAAFVALESL